MNNELQEVISLDNGKEYIVVDRIAYNSNFYVMLVCADENDDETIIQKEVLEGTEFVLKPIEHKEEFDALISKFALKTICP